MRSPPSKQRAPHPATLQRPAARVAGALQRMRRGPSTAEFDNKHVCRIADNADPFDVLAAQIVRARLRLLNTAYNRNRGIISASTILILTATQYQQFQAGVDNGHLNNHAYTCAITVVAATDAVTYYGAGSFDVRYRLGSQTSIDDLWRYHSAQSGNVGEYQSTHLFLNAGIYTGSELAGYVRIATRVTGVADRIGAVTPSGYQQVDIYAQNSNAAIVSNQIQMGAPLFVKSTRIAPTARDWYLAAGRLFA